MRRFSAAAITVLVLAACGISGAPSLASETLVPGSQPAEPESSAPEETAEATPSSPSVPEGHPADGLALIRIPNEADPRGQIFIVEADGSLRQVTGVSGDLGASFPVWSPDGSQIAFGGPKLGEVTTFGQLGVVNADGTGERQIGQGQFPQWSPDGTRIAFNEVDDVTGTDLSMYVVDVGSGETADLGIGYFPRWLSDDRFVFISNTYAADGEASQHLYVMDLPGGEPQLVADGTEAYPSPDRSAVLLVHEGVITLTGLDLAPGGRELANGGAPVWSPVGTRVIFDYGHDEQARPIHAIVDLEGNALLSDIAGASPTWSPDGSRIAVEYYRPDGLPAVHVIDAASGELLWETEGMQPAWAP
jgi:Tol biopolymer transport system component